MTRGKVLETRIEINDPSSIVSIRPRSSLTPTSRNLFSYNEREKLRGKIRPIIDATRINKIVRCISPRPSSPPNRSRKNELFDIQRVIFLTLCNRMSYIIYKYNKILQIKLKILNVRII